MGALERLCERALGRAYHRFGLVLGDLGRDSGFALGWILLGSGGLSVIGCLHWLYLEGRSKGVRLKL